MKIYILRHEDRTQDCSFFSPLTETGLNNTVKLATILTKHDIDTIFCSPFIRTLQTIYPYLKQKKYKVNLEYGLSELHHPDIISKRAVGISLPEYLAITFNYEPEYKTVIKPNEISYPENDKQVGKRVKKVLYNIFVKYAKTDKNIILVSHQSICLAVLRLINKYSEEFKNKLTSEQLTVFGRGKCCLIYDNGWTYKPIN
jgi:broad specificity phosphatase PhoE